MLFRSAERANARRKQMIFQPGDWVWLHLRKERFPKQRKSKLSPRGDGPFQVIEKVNDNAYKLDLPGEYGVHATFNVSDLTPFRADDERLMEQPFKEEGDDVSTPADDIRLPPGPMTRSRAKKFQDAVTALVKVHDIMDDEALHQYDPGDTYFHVLRAGEESN